MATATNNFDTGIAPGTTITTANSDDNGAGTAFNAIFGTGTKTFETRGSGLAAKMTSVGNTTSVLEWTSAVGTVATGGFAHANAEYMLPALPGAGLGGALIGLMVASSDSFVGDWRINSDGKLEQRTGAGTLINTSTNSITAGQWFKLHFSVLAVSNSGSGQLRCRLFLDPTSNTPTETLQTAATLNLGGTDIAKYRFGTLRNLTDFTVYVDNARASTVSEAPVNASVITGPLAGATTDTGFKAFFQTIDGAGLNHRLVVSTTSDLATSPVYSSAVTPDSDGFVQPVISGLSANTLYYYGLEVNSVLLPTGRGSVQTDPVLNSKSSISIAFGSCNFTVPTAVTFDRIKNYNGPFGKVRRFNHLGDLNYQNWTGSSTRTEIINQHQVTMNSAAMQPLFASTTTTYQWDNHDWGGDFSDKDNPIGSTVAEVYRKMFPSYSLPASDGVGIWFTYQIGRIQFIAYDNRSQRDNYSVTDGPLKSLMGAEQKAWFKARLQDPAPIKVILSGIYWRQDNPGSDRWGSYGTEFNELNDFIAANGKGEFYVVFGDRHALCASNGSDSGTRGMPQAGGGIFQQGSVASGETWSQGYWSDPPNVLQGYGILDIEDAGDTVTINYTGYSSIDNVAQITMTTVFNVDQETVGVGYDAAGAFGTPAVTTGPVAVAATGITTGEAYGTPTVTTGPVTVTATGVGSDLAFGVPTVAQATQLTATGVPSGEMFGLAVAATGGVTVTATGVATGEAFGVPTQIPGPTTVTATGVGSDLAFGVPSVGLGSQYVTATGIPGDEQFGFPTVQINQNITTIGIATGEAYGVPVVSVGPITVQPAGIGSDLAFGVPSTTTGNITVTAVGWDAGGYPGIPIVTQAGPPSQTIAATGIATGEAFGAGAEVRPGALTLPAFGIPTGEAFGLPLSSVGMVMLEALGIVTGEAFGNLHIIGGNDGQVFAATAVPSAEAFGEALAFAANGGDCECSVPVAG